MNNKEIYRKTLGFSIRRLLWDILAFVILAVMTIVPCLYSYWIYARGKNV